MKHTARNIKYVKADKDILHLYIILILYQKYNLLKHFSICSGQQTTNVSMSLHILPTEYCKSAQIIFLKLNYYFSLNFFKLLLNF
ncbi:hypothetical protein X975_21799, partial [Stegodyphus mimosarum]